MRWTRCTSQPICCNAVNLDIQQLFGEQVENHGQPTPGATKTGWPVQPPMSWPACRLRVGGSQQSAQVLKWEPSSGNCDFAGPSAQPHGPTSASDVIWLSSSSSLASSGASPPGGEGSRVSRSQVGMWDGSSCSTAVWTDSLLSPSPLPPATFCSVLCLYLSSWGRILNDAQNHSNGS